MSVDWTPKNITILRNVLSLSAEEFSQKIGITSSILIEIENGKRFATMFLLARVGKIYHDNLYHIDLSVKESEESDGMGFLKCISKTFPLSSGASSISPPSQYAKVYLDLLLPEINEQHIQELIEKCLLQNKIELIEIKINNRNQ